MADKRDMCSPTVGGAERWNGGLLAKSVQDIWRKASEKAANYPLLLRQVSAKLPIYRTEFGGNVADLWRLHCWIA